MMGMLFGATKNLRISPTTTIMASSKS